MPTPKEVEKRWLRVKNSKRESIFLPKSEVKEILEQQAKHAGGRPQGVMMPCGWNCGCKLTAREMRPHFTNCPNRPEK